MPYIQIYQIVIVDSLEEILGYIHDSFPEVYHGAICNDGYNLTASNHLTAGVKD